MAKYLSLIIVIIFCHYKVLSQVESDSICNEPATTFEEAIKMKNCLLALIFDDVIEKNNILEYLEKGIFQIDSNFNKCINTYFLEVNSNRKIKINIDFSKFQKLKVLRIFGKIRNYTFNESISKVDGVLPLEIHFFDNKCMIPKFLFKINNSYLRCVYETSFDTTTFLKIFINALPYIKAKTISIKGKRDEKFLFNSKMKIYFEKIEKIVKRKRIYLNLFENIFSAS